jgi:hypothetical protein
MTMKRAVLIASANFEPDSGIEPLRFPQDDVRALSPILETEEFGFNSIVPIIDKDNNDVLEQLEGVMSEMDFGDFLLIYYSGHGKINQQGKLFLTARNTKAKRLNATGIKYSQIMDMIEAHQIDRVGIVLDCCYAGLAVTGLKGSPQEQVEAALKDIGLGRGICVLSASGDTQTAAEGETHGVFTKHLIDGLIDGSADFDNDGAISLTDVHKYIRAEFKKYKIPQDVKLTNVDKSGDLILGTSRKHLHLKMISTVRNRLEPVRPHISKKTYRRIEDYLDEVSNRSDLNSLLDELRYGALQSFASDGSLEAIIDAFREPAPAKRVDIAQKPAVSADASIDAPGRTPSTNERPSPEAVSIRPPGIIGACFRWLLYLLTASLFIAAVGSMSSESPEIATSMFLSVVGLLSLIASIRVRKAHRQAQFESMMRKAMRKE